ncbi:MAG TPA: DMT family transporter [Gaiellales bacterium]
MQRLPPAAGVLALAALWGASYLFIKVALHDFTPVFVSWLRLACGLAVVLPVAARAGVLHHLRGRGRHLLIVASLQIALPVTLVAVGELWIASSLAGLLNATVPLFVALLAPAVGQAEPMGGRRALGLVIGFAGVACIVGIDLGDNRNLLLGAACLTLSSLGYALGNLTGKRYLSDVPPLAIVAGLLATAAVLTAPLALAGLPSHAPGLRPVAAVLALGAAGTGLAYLLYYGVMLRIGPARTSLVAYLIPLFAIAYGVVLLHEPLTAGLAAGMPLVLAGCWLAGRRA